MNTTVRQNELISHPPALGCVLYMPGIPGGSGCTYDRSMYGNHGSINSAVWKKIPGGLWVLDFNGVNSYVEFLCRNSLNLTSVFSMEAWIYSTDVTNSQVIAKHDSYDKSGYILSFNSSDKMRFQAGDGVTWQFIDEVAGTAVTENSWHYVALVRNHTQLVFVLDGELDGIAVVSSNPIIANTKHLWIGRDVNIGSGGEFEGMIALVRIYNNVALSPLQFREHYRREKNLFGV